MKVTVKNIEGHKVLKYVYEANEHLSFAFHLISEVGEPWQAEAAKQAHQLAMKHRGVIKQIELSASPWYVDAIVKGKP